MSVYRYITQNTFDAYLWGIQENKQKFISQIMTNKSAVRSCDDIDSAVLDCAEVKTLATGDPRIKEKMQLDNDIYLLQIEKSAYQKERITLQNIVMQTPKKLEATQSRIVNLQSDIERFNLNKTPDFAIIINGIFYDERAKAGEQLNKLLATNSTVNSVLGQYCGFDLVSIKSSFFENRQLIIRGETDNYIDLGESAVGNITRIENGCEVLDRLLEISKQAVKELNKQHIDAQIELEKPFFKEHELKEKLQKQIGLNIQMEHEAYSNAVLEVEPVEGKEVGRGGMER